MTKEEIEALYDEYCKARKASRDAKITKTKELPDTYVIDENKSVKWNREQVQLMNEKIKEEKDTKISYRAECTKKLLEAIRIYIKDNYNIPSSVYDNMRNFMYTWDEDDYYFNNGIENALSFLEDLAEVINLK